MAEDTSRDPFAASGPDQPGMGDAPQSGAGKHDPYGAAPAPYATPTPGEPPAASAQPTGITSEPQAGGNQNVLGILSVIAPFVGLSLVGIILGHLGLSAAARGRATNRGVALAGTIISWVVTVIVGIVGVVLAVVAINESDGTISDAEALQELRALREAVQGEIDAGALSITVDQTVDGYLVNDREVASEVTVDAVELQTSAVGFCVAVRYNDTDLRSIDHTGILHEDNCEAYAAASAPHVAPAGIPESAEYYDTSSDLEVGQCFLDPYDPALQLDDGSYEVRGIYVVPCEEQHYGEIYLTGELADGVYPGDEAIWEELDARCSAAFEEYVGIAYADSELYLDYFYPTETGWVYGQRDFQCMVVPFEGILEGSVEGAGI